MEVIQVGRHWFLHIGRVHLEFTHNGTGKVQMGQEGHWEEVTPRWAGDHTLCWGSVCTKGELPLD